MRVDKFLKLTRIIKRRSVAKDASENGRVWINGKEAKPSGKVKVGDILEIRFGHKLLTIRVEELHEHVRKEQSDQMFTLLEEKYVEDDLK